MSINPYFSIIIPSLNEEKYLPLLLKDLSQQSFKNFEVIHVDANSEDKTREKAKQFLQKINLKIINVKKRGVGYQRNLGGKKAKGQYIIFMDADNRLPKNFLQDLYNQLYKNNQIDIFTCLVDSQLYQLEHQPYIQLLNALTLIMEKTKPIALGALIGIKNNFLTNNSFNEDMQFVEDLEFVKQATQRGLKFTCFKEPKYYYSIRRIKKEGTFKIILISAKKNLQFLAGEKFIGLQKDYPMLGGKYYNQKTKNIFDKFEKQLNRASKQQLNKIKKLIHLLQSL